MYKHLQHDSIAAILEALPAKALRQNKLYFAGGTALVLQSVAQKWAFGPEYRRSDDIAFLCTTREYADARALVIKDGIKTFIGDLKLAREVRFNDRGIRTFVVSPKTGKEIKFEIVCEGYIPSLAPQHVVHGVSCVRLVDGVAQKLIANSDRWPDRDKGLRDYIDLVAISSSLGGLPMEGVRIAEAAYDVNSVAAGVTKAHDLLGSEGFIEKVAGLLDLTPHVVANLKTFAKKLRSRLWPSLSPESLFP